MKKHIHKDMDQNAKTKFRKTKAWLDFKSNLKSEQQVDYITGAKLNRTSSCHHMDMNEDHYKDLNPEHFVMLNKASHQYIHWLYQYYKNDKTVINKIVEILEKMIIITGE